MAQVNFDNLRAPYDVVERVKAQGRNIFVCITPAVQAYISQTGDSLDNKLIARIMGVSITTVSRYNRGEHTNPDMRHLEKLARYLGCEPKTFFFSVKKEEEMM